MIGRSTNYRESNVYRYKVGISYSCNGVSGRDSRDEPEKSDKVNEMAPVRLDRVDVIIISFWFLFIGIR